MHVVGIIQARMGSRRLPGKMLMPLGGRPLIDWIASRAAGSQLCNQIVVATTELHADDPLAEWCRRENVECFRGSPDDVLDRYFHCARRHGATHVVRLTGDCPLLDPRIIDRVVALALDDERVQYATNCEPATFPEGMSAEVLPMDVLDMAHRQASLANHREHVTLYVRLAPERFRHAVLRATPDLSHLRLTVDYREDQEALDELIRELAARHLLDGGRLEDVVSTLMARPDIQARLAIHQRDLWRKEVMPDARRIA
jgi:spore coat polysaccharide biosynthesis protein SpsF (cytidylyltransferase family)